jgi:16S rRNA (guanine527-N7)-methyltransferase
VTSPSDGLLEARIGELAERFELPAGATEKLVALVGRLIDDPRAPSSIHTLDEVVDRHLADSLVALELESVRSAGQVLDLGSGAGLPGLPLAAALPHKAFVLLESVGRKCAFIERTAEACGIANVQVVNSRAESFQEGLARFDLITARAVAVLDVTIEYAAPLLRIGGVLVAWAGKRVPEVESAATRAAAAVGLGGLEVVHVKPFPASQHQHLYLLSKVRETPAAFPRRPGIAAKRPLGRTASSTGRSDRAGR